jgi:hypothetical protein
MKHVTFVHYTQKVVEWICSPVEAISFSLQRAAIKIYRLFDYNEEPTGQ